MDPRHDPDLILGHLEGDLSPEDAAKVQALREADPDFAALLDGLAGDRDLLRAAPGAEPPAGLADAAMADLERSMLLDDADDGIAMLPPGRRRRFAIAPLLTYGGIAAVLALTASAVLKSVQPPATSPTIAAAPAGDGFDIAAAPIQAQRELARLDRAEVGFGADDTADLGRLETGAGGPVVAETAELAGLAAPPAADRVDRSALDDASPPPTVHAKGGLADADVQNTTRQAKTSASEIVVDAAPRPEEFQNKGAEPSAAFNNDAFSAVPVARAAAPGARALGRAATFGSGSPADRRAVPGVVAANETLTLDEAAADPGAGSAAFTLDAVYVPGDATDPVSIAIRKLLSKEAGESNAAPPALPQPGDLIRGITPAPTATPAWDQPLDPLGTDWARWTTLTPQP